MPSASPPTLIQALLGPEPYDHPVERCQLIETHISWVILTGSFAYKIKKPLDLGFLDFSILEKRRFYCEEELRLNRRLAPGIYLEVVPITGTEQEPVINGKGEAFEYAVKMVQFPQQVQLDRMLDQGLLSSQHLDAFAVFIADFHRKAEVIGRTEEYGHPAQVWQPMEENFTQIRERITDKYWQRLNALEAWSREAFRRLEPVLLQRRTEGFIRECHGDMHLRNLAWHENGPIAFDGIEFNPNLRWIDVISEVAFLVMDLQAREEPGLAQRFLNGYLEQTGDYAGVKLLPLYLVYRAMVRAKVSAIRLGQKQLNDEERGVTEGEFVHYLTLAERYTHATPKCLLITHGLSGSGKTTLSQPVLETLPALRIRSDVERKRLYGMSALESVQAAPAEGIYSAAATVQTYARLRELAATVLDAGYSVIIDATFLQPGQRESFERLAKEKEVGYGILEFTAGAQTLRRRLQRRRGDASDADLVVLEHQIAGYTPLTEREQGQSITIDTEGAFEPERLVQRIRAML